MMSRLAQWHHIRDKKRIIRNERREREENVYMWMRMYVCMCVREKEREKAGNKKPIY